MNRQDRLRGLNCRIVECNADKPDSLSAAMRGVHRVFICTPSTETRAVQTIRMAEAARNAGVQHVGFISVPAVNAPYTLFGSQYKEIEDRIRALGIRSTALRCNLFMDNFQMNADTIKNEQAIVMPFNPDAPYAPIAVADVARAAAALINSPRSFKHRAYTLTGPETVTLKNICDYLASALGKEMKLITVPYETAHKSLVEKGIPDWSARGLMELYHLIDEGRYLGEVSRDYERLTGHRGTPMHQWVREHAALFV